MLKSKKVISIVICIVLLAGFTFYRSLPAQGGPVKTINNGKPVTLLVDFAQVMPTVAQKVSAQNPNVQVAGQKLADAFMKMYPNVKIKWAWSKPPMSTLDGVAEWLTTVIAGGTAPDILFAWGNAYADRGWFMRLNEVLDKPNEYVQGNKKWRDLFPEYLFETGQNLDVKGNIIAIPFTVYPGPATAIYYNKQIFSKLGLKPVSDWEDFIQLCKKIKQNGYTAFGPWIGNKKASSNNWDVQFSLGYPYANYVFNRIDYSKNGKLEPLEGVRFSYEGNTLVSKNDNVKDLWKQVKRKFTEVMDKGYANTDYENKWLDGKLAMIEDGLWRLPGELSNTKREFDFGMFPPPVISSKSSKYVGKVEYTKSGPYKPMPMDTFNIVEPSIKAHGGEGVRQAAIEFLKYCSKPENLSTMVLELKGKSIGAVKGTKIPPELNEWLKNSFPKMAGYGWPGTGYTTKGATAMSKQLEMWVKGSIDDKKFYEEFDKQQKADMDSYVQKMNISTKGWKKGW